MNPPNDWENVEIGSNNALIASIKSNSNVNVNKIPNNKHNVHGIIESNHVIIKEGKA